MIVSSDLWKSTIDALRFYTNVDSNVLFSDKVIEVLHNIDKHLDGLLNQPSVKNSQKARVKKLLLHLSENIDKTLNFIENPPKEIKMFLFNYLLYQLGINQEEPKLDEYLVKEIMKVYPLRVRAGKKKEYYMVYPDENELAKLHNPEVVDLEFVLRKILLHNIQIDFEKRSVGIRGYDSLILPPKGFIRALMISGIQNDKILEEVYSDIVSELSKYGVVSVRDESPVTGKIKVELDGIGRELSRKYGVEHVSFVMEVEINKEYDSAYIGYYVKLNLNGNEIYYQPDSYWLEGLYSRICREEACTTPISFTKNEDISSLPTKISAYINIGYKVADYLVKTIKTYYDLTQKHGFRFSINSYGGIYKPITAEKNGRYGNAMIELHPFGTVSNLNGVPELYYSVTVSSKPHIISYLRRKIRDTLDKDEKYVVYNGGESIRIFKTTELNEEIDLDSAFKRTNTLLSIIDEIINEAHTNYSKENMNLPDEVYIALYLVLRVSKRRIRIEKITNANPSLIEEAVGSIVEKHKINVDKSTNGYDDVGSIVDPLIREKYITIDEDLKVYINGKRLSDLLVENFPSIDRREAREAEKGIIDRLVGYYKYISEYKGKLFTQILLERGLLIDSLIRKAIEAGKIIEPENFTIEVNGKPLWHYLSEETKLLYITKAELSLLNIIFNNPELKEAFSDKLDVIEKLIISGWDPSEKTKHVFINSKYSNIIGSDVDLVGVDYTGKISSQEEVLQRYNYDTAFLRPEYAKHLLVQVLDVGKEFHKFIVVNSNTKTGFVIKARNLKEAVEVFEKQYDRLEIMFTQVREMCRTKMLYDINPREVHITGTPFTYKCVEKRTEDSKEILPVDENTVKDVKRHIYRKEENEESVSA